MAVFWEMHKQIIAYIFLSVRTSKANVINETELQLIKSSVYKEGYRYHCQ